MIDLAFDRIIFNRVLRHGLGSVNFKLYFLILSYFIGNLKYFCELFYGV